MRDGDPSRIHPSLQTNKRPPVRLNFKQWGGTRKHETGRPLDGRTYDEFPPAFHRVLAASSA